jgi:crotonyl-CoA carboxylase/reductase
MAHKTVSDLMHKGVIACGPETLMSEVVRIVNDTSVHAIVVMDDDGNPIGTVSHMDIIRFYGRDLSEHQARDAMSGPVIAIESDEAAAQGVALMVAHGVERLLVVETEAGKATPVGMLSTTDLVKDMRGARWIWHVG